MTSERALREAERAALAQRSQLETLLRDFQALDHHFAALELESARQSDDLSHLEEQLADLRAQAGLPRPSAEDLAAVDTADLPERAAPTTRAATSRPPSPTSGLTPPALGDDWEAYIRNVERYLADHGLEATRDPLPQLLPAHRAAEIQRRFEAEFVPTPWDRWDYGAVSLAVLVGAIFDYLLVATPGKKFKGVPQRGSPLTKWMKEQSEKVAPIKAADDIQRNAFQQWMAGLTTAAEKWAKVPIDLLDRDLDKKQYKPLGLTPNVHRLATPGHDPLLGLVFGVKDIMSGTCTLIDKHGKWRVIDNPRFDGDPNVLKALVKVIVHGFSDVFTAQGLPPPFMGQLLPISANSGLTLKKDGDPVSVRNVVRYMYANGYDLRHFATTKISPAVAEIILSAYHGVRACADGSDPGEPAIPERLKRAQMLALTHGLLASANILKTALYGWNPTAINLAQFQALAKRMLSLVELAVERDREVRRRLTDGWEALLAEVSANDN